MDRREDAVFQVRVAGQQYWAIEGPAWGGVETRVGIVEAGLLSHLLHLAHENIDAIDKLAHGQLGFWGKIGLQSRTADITKILRKLMTLRVRRMEPEHLAESIYADLIELHPAFPQITDADLKYLANCLPD